jgi:hypothetical protein
MPLGPFIISLLVTAIVAFSARPAEAGGCLKDTRQTKVDQANAARLLDYLCTSEQDAQTRVRVQFQRLSGLATGAVLNGGSAPWLSALYGNYKVADNEVLKEYKTLISRFGSAVREVDQGGGDSIYLGLLAGPAPQVTSGELSETTRGQKGQVVRSFKLAPLPDIPLVDETLQILNEQTWPASLNMSYNGDPQDENASPADALSLWRYLTAADASQYEERLRRYKALVVDRSWSERPLCDRWPESQGCRKAQPKSMELLNYLTANGWPENFLYVSTEMAKIQACLTMDFRVHQYSFEVEVAIIENVSAKPITINQLFGQAGGSNQLRQAASVPRTTPRQALPGEPVTLAPSSRLIVPLRLVFAADDPITVGEKAASSEAEERKQAQESFRKIMARPPGTVFRTEIYSALRGKTRGKEKDTYVIRKVRESFKPPSYPAQSDFTFGPEWAFTGLAIGSEAIAFEATPPNVILITASSEAGSCPILYSWDTRTGTWVRHGKVLHQAQTQVREGSESVQFDGLVHRFRIVEEELERAIIRQASLQLQLSDGHILTLYPQLRSGKHPGQDAAESLTELYANDEIEITFALPVDLDPSHVVQSAFTITGYYDRYATLLLSAAGGRTKLDGN